MQRTLYLLIEDKSVILKLSWHDAENIVMLIEN